MSRSSGSWKKAFIGTVVVGGMIRNAQSSWVDPDTPAVEKRSQLRALTPGDDRMYDLVRTFRLFRSMHSIPIVLTSVELCLFRFSQMSLKSRDGHLTMAMTHVGLRSTKTIVSRLEKVLNSWLKKIYARLMQHSSFRAVRYQQGSPFLQCRKCQHKEGCLAHHYGTKREFVQGI